MSEAHGMWAAGPASGIAQHLACDHQLHDLACAFKEAQQSRVAEQALDRRIAHIAVAAMQLHRTIGDAPHRLRRKILGAGRVAGNRSEEHTAELQALMRISYAVFCLKKQTYT